MLLESPQVGVTAGLQLIKCVSLISLETSDVQSIENTRFTISYGKSSISVSIPEINNSFFRARCLRL